MITHDEYFFKAKSTQEAVLDLIKNYHPVYRSLRSKATDKITAISAELACTNIRKSIQDSTPESFVPTQAYVKAIEDKDIATIMKILNDTWFGVPETTMCWTFKGFKQAVDLIEDFPE